MEDRGMDTEEKLESMYEDYRDEYYQEAKDNYAEYKTVRVFDTMMVSHYCDGEYNQQVLTNNDELEELAFNMFKEDFEKGKIKLEQ
jgi:hypothetical protein